MECGRFVSVMSGVVVASGIGCGRNDRVTRAERHFLLKIFFLVFVVYMWQELRVRGVCV